MGVKWIIQFDMSSVICDLENVDYDFCFSFQEMKRTFGCLKKLLTSLHRTVFTAL